MTQDSTGTDTESELDIDLRDRPMLLVITPAHNEMDNLQSLARSIAAQTVAPDIWVIVDDRSTDQTARVAKSIEAELPFATYLRRSGTNSHRSFSGKVQAFNAGYERFGLHEPHFVACVDADVALPQDYFERVIAEFQTDPTLGVCGGVYVEPSGRIGRHGGGSVPGPAQVFRFETFDEIGGFRALPRGGEDALACAYARRNGWRTAPLPDLKFRHLRRMGGGGGRSSLRAAFDHGRQDWDVGIDPFFELIRMVPRMQTRPIVLAAVTRLLGFGYGALRRTHQVDPDMIRFSRAEQRGRLFGPFRRRMARVRRVTGL